MLIKGATDIYVISSNISVFIFYMQMDAILIVLDRLLHFQQMFMIHKDDVNITALQQVCDVHINKGTKHSD